MVNNMKCCAQPKNINSNLITKKEKLDSIAFMYFVPGSGGKK